LHYSEILTRAQARSYTTTHWSLVLSAPTGHAQARTGKDAVPTRRRYDIQLKLDERGAGKISKKRPRRRGKNPRICTTSPKARANKLEEAASCRGANAGTRLPKYWQHRLSLDTQQTTHAVPAAVSVSIGDWQASLCRAGDGAV
jgi:hypothetical protein